MCTSTFVRDAALLWVNPRRNRLSGTETLASGQLVIFNMADKGYALRAESVVEILKPQPTTRIHHAPDYVRGVINLRGSIVTIIDLASKLGLTLDGTRPPAIIIVPFEGEHVGLYTEEIDDIIATATEDIEPPPNNLQGINGSYLEAVYKTDERLIGILNVEEVLKLEDEDA